MNIQKGRLMMEILSVLAIVGVLSITAVVGFKMAMNKNRTNLLMEDVRLAAFTVLDEMFETLTEEKKDLKDNFISQTDYPFLAFKESDTTFGIVVENIPFSICREAQNRHTKWLEEVHINSNKKDCQKDDLNTLTFFFNTNMQSLTKPKECRTTADCLEGLACSSDYVCLCEKGYYSPTGKGVCTPCHSGKGNQDLGSTYCLCEENSDCINGEEFCLYPVGKPKMTGKPPAVQLANYGQCRSLKESDKKIISIDDILFTAGNTQMNWWSCMNWCEAQNLILVDVPEVCNGGMTTEDCKASAVYDVLIAQIETFWTRRENVGWWGDDACIVGRAPQKIVNCGAPKEHWTYGFRPVCIKK